MKRTLNRVREKDLLNLLAEEEHHEGVVYI